MFCWHKWTVWSQPKPVKLANLLGQVIQGYEQTKNCTKCGKFKRNIL